MKQASILFFLCCNLLTGYGYAQKLDQAKVPAAVNEAFHKRYPAIKAGSWEYNKSKNVYGADYLSNKKKYTVFFDPSGVWVKTEREIKQADLPAAVVKAYKQSVYASWKVKDIEEHETPEYKLVYRIEAKNGDNKLDLRFLPDGRLISAK